MVAVMCWLVVHTSNNALDNRSEIKLKGHVVFEEGGGSIGVDFYEGFEANHIDMSVNDVKQIVNENSCLYE